MVVYRKMVPEDIPSGLRLCREAGWNQTRADWELFLQRSPHGCVVAVDDHGRIIGSVATLRYQDHFSWIGMVLVDPAVRRQGIGKQLLRESLHILRDAQTVRLDATPDGRAVYLQLGFTDEYPLTRMVAPAGNHVGEGHANARLINPRDLAAVWRLDRAVFGADRAPMLTWYHDKSPQYACVLEDGGGVKSFCFGREGHHFAHIGPVVAQDTNAAIAVLATALEQHSHKPVAIDVPHHSAAWMNFLESRGFTAQRPLMRMSLGSNRWSGIPGRQFAILGPEFG